MKIKAENLTKKFSILFLAIVMVITYTLSPFALQLNAATSTKVTAMRLSEWNTDAGVEHKLDGLKVGKTYTVTFYWKYVAGVNPYFQVGGDAIGEYKSLIVGKVPTDIVSFNTETGLVSYTFVSKGTNIVLAALMGSEKGFKDVYFAKPSLFESDSNGNKILGSTRFNCDQSFKTSWIKWSYGGDYRSVVEVTSDFFKIDDVKALKTLDVGYDLSPKFYSFVTDYKVNIPYTADKLNVKYTLFDGAKLDSITGNNDFKEGETKKVLISVLTKENEIVTYTIDVFKEYNSQNMVKALRLHDWNCDAGVNNNVKVVAGKTYTFTVYFKYICGKNPLFQLGGPAVSGNKTIIETNVITDENAKFNPETGLLSYTFTAAGDNIEMSAQMGSGQGENDLYFAKPTLFESDINGNPLENGETIDCDPLFETSWKHWNYGGDYRSIEYVSPDFLKVQDNQALKSLDVGYKLSPSFYSYVLDYNVTVPYTVDFLDINCVLSDGAKLDGIEGNSNFSEGKTTIVKINVVNPNNDLITYTINVTKEINPSNAITVMYLNEWNTDAGVSNTVNIEEGKTYTCTFLWKSVKGDGPLFVLSGDAVGNINRYLIVGNEPEADVNYNPVTGLVTYTFVSKGTELSLSGQLGAGTGEKGAYFAKPTLFESDLVGKPIINSKYFDCDEKFEKSWVHWGYGGNYRHIETVLANFFERTDFPLGLENLSVGYNLTPKFDYRIYTYDITVPYTVNKLDIKYKLSSGVTFKNITGNENFEDGKTKSVVISVTSSDNTEISYKIRVKREIEPTASLKSLDVGFALTPSFNKDIYNYTLSLSNDVKNIDAKFELSDNSSFVSIDGNKNIPVGVPTDVVITLKNSQGIENKYVITVTRNGAGGDTSALNSILEQAKAKLNLTNNATNDSLKNDLQSLVGKGYKIAVSEFYKLSAINGVSDNKGEIISPSNGYVSAKINITDGNNLAIVPMVFTIKANIVSYTFNDDEISKDSDFELEDNGKYLSSYVGNARKVIIPDTVEEIGFGWYQADDLKSCEVLVIPNSVKFLPNKLCYGMKHLETVSFGDGTTELPAEAFDRCIFLQNVKLSENLTDIGTRSFAGTTSLSQLRISNSVKSIGQMAFYFSMLREITVPANVTNIADSAFASPFNAAFQLVKGSDNMYFMFVFDDDSDPDLKRLTDISDSLVDYYDSRGNSYDKLADAPIGIQWGEQNPWPNGPVYVTPRTVTILGKDVKIGKDVGYTHNGFYNGGVTLRFVNGSSAIDIVNKEIIVLEEKRQQEIDKTGSEQSVVGLKVEILNMSLSEVLSRINFEADHFNINKSTTADEILRIVNNSFVSSVIDSVVWKNNFEIKDNKAFGTLTVNSGSYKFDISFDTLLKDIVATGEKDEQNKDNLNPSISDSLVPITVKKGSRLVKMNWEDGIMTVKKFTKISEFLKDITIADGYKVVFYDDDGYEIYDVFWDTAFFEDGFKMNVIKGYSRVNEFVFETVDYIPNTGDLSNPILVVILVVVSVSALAGITVLLKRKMK